MLGAVVVILAVLVLPFLMMQAGLVIAAVLGSLLTNDAETRHQGSELVDLHR